MGFAVRVRSAGQKYGPTCHQRDRADVTEFVTLVRLSSLGQHVDVLALAGYKRRKSALTAGPIGSIIKQIFKPCSHEGFRIGFGSNSLFTLCLQPILLGPVLEVMLASLILQCGQEYQTRSDLAWPGHVHKWSTSSRVKVIPNPAVITFVCLVTAFAFFKLGEMQKQN